MQEQSIVISFNSLTNYSFAIGQMYNKKTIQTNLSVYISKISSKNSKLPAQETPRKGIVQNRIQFPFQPKAPSAHRCQL